MSATPSRVLPGLKMAGHMGAERVKIRKLEVTFCTVIASYAVVPSVYHALIYSTVGHIPATVYALNQTVFLYGNIKRWPPAHGHELWHAVKDATYRAITCLSMQHRHVCF